MHYTWFLLYPTFTVSHIYRIPCLLRYISSFHRKLKKQLRVHSCRVDFPSPFVRSEPENQEYRLKYWAHSFARSLTSLTPSLVGQWIMRWLFIVCYFPFWPIVRPYSPFPSACLLPIFYCFVLGRFHIFGDSMADFPASVFQPREKALLEYENSCRERE